MGRRIEAAFGNSLILEPALRTLANGDELSRENRGVLRSWVASGAQNTSVVLVFHAACCQNSLFRSRAGPAPVAPGLRLEDAHAHLRRAEELARLGRYAEALAHRFTAVILELESARALHFHPSKTPAEYAGEAALDAAGRATLTGLVARLYRHLFGAVPCDAQGYRDFGADAQLVLQHVLPR